MITKTWVPAAVATSLVLSAGLLGCGVQAQNSPQLIEPTTVPYNLLEPASSRAGPVNTPAETPATATIYFMSDDYLRAVERSVPGRSPRERVDKILRLLTEGPSPTEQGQSLRSTIPSGVELSVADLNEDLVTVDLSGEFESGSAEENITAVAQIVLSVTSVNGIDGVLLTVNGQRADGPRGDGTLTGAPLTAVDYLNLMAEGPSRTDR